MKLAPGRARAIAAAIVAVALAAVATLLLVVEREPDGGRASPLEVVDSRQVGARLLEFTTRSPSLNGDAKVRVLLPEGYDESQRSFPVLYLLHPARGNARFWSETADVAALTDGLPLIVVMPDAGAFGFYSNWQDIGDREGPQWESYHLEELIPWVESEFRTLDGRDGRAVAGASMGGLGAIMYAARHPELFAAAASLSGPVQLEPGQISALMRAVGRDPSLPMRIWGPPETEIRNWVAHDPVALAPALEGVEVILSSGDGRPRGYEGPMRDRIEAAIRIMNVRLHRRLSQLGIPHVWRAGPGAHNISAFRAQLASVLPRLVQAFEVAGA